MSRIYGNIGFKGLWNGLPVRIAMVCFAKFFVLSGGCRSADSVLDWNLDCLPMAHLRYFQGKHGFPNDWRALEGQ